jgi:DNA polymerase-1
MNGTTIPPHVLGDVRACTRCKYSGTRYNVVPNKIIPNAPLLFIAQAPGTTEDSQGIEPLTGDAGQVFTQALEHCGSARRDVSLANIVQCFPGRDPAKGGDAEPERECVKACSAWLDRDITTAAPKVIVPFGNVALKALTGRTGITALNGKPIFDESYPGAMIIPVLHPAAVLPNRSPEKFPDFLFGMSQAIKYATGVVTDTTVNNKYTICENWDQVDQCLKELEGAHTFSIDLETSSLDFLNGYVIMIGVSTQPRTGWCIPVMQADPEMYKAIEAIRKDTKSVTPIPDPIAFCRERGIPEPKYLWKDKPEFKERLGKIVADPNKIKLLHNYVFDAKFLKRFGCPISAPFFDTMIGHYLLNETRGTHGLKDLAYKLTDLGDYDRGIREAKRHNDDSYGIIETSKLGRYCCIDADATIRLYEDFVPKLQEQGLDKPMSGLMIPACELLNDVEEHGILFDKQYCAELQKVLTKSIGDLDQMLKIAVGDMNVNLGSPKQLADILFGKLKLPIIKMSESGKTPSTDAEVLEQLAKINDIPRNILELRKMKKLLSTYVDGVEKFVWSDGKVHADFHLTGTETGRLSISNPPLQTIPRDTKKYNVKGLFIPTPGYVMVEMDYSQAELRVLAHLSQDPELIRCYKEGIDLHDEVTYGVLGVDKNAPQDLKDKMRMVAKGINFGISYGRGSKSLAEEVGISVDDAAMYIEEWKNRFSGAAAWQQMTIQFAKINGYVETMYGRRRRLPGVLSSENAIRTEAERQSINSPIQGSASDLTLWSSIKIQKELKSKFDFFTLNLIHDSILWEVRKDHLFTFCDAAREIAHNPPGMSVPVDTKFLVNYPRWGINTKLMPIEKMLTFDEPHRPNEKSEETNDRLRRIEITHSIGKYLAT